MKRFAPIPVALAAVALFAASASAGTVTIASNSDVLAGRSAFLAAGTTTVQFNWVTLFPGGSTWSGGSLPPSFSTPSVSVTLPDSTVNSVVGKSPSTLNFGNWLDAPGFNGSGGVAAPDLAINGVESFDLVFGQGHMSVGFGIATGQGNLPSEFDLLGTQFQFTAKDGSGNVIGTATLSLTAGGPAQAWVTLTADTAFRRIEVRETGAAGSDRDQYFTNILTSVEAVPVGVVPLPPVAASGLAIGGLAGLIRLARRRRSAAR